MNEDERTLTEKVYTKFAEWHHKTNGKSSVAIISGMLIGAFILGVAIGNYDFRGKISRYNKEKKDKKQAQLETKMIEYNKCYNRLFGFCGLADKNRDTFVSFDEKAEAYKKMGLDIVINNDIVNTPIATIEQLQRLIRMYEEENRAALKPVY